MTPGSLRDQIDAYFIGLAEETLATIEVPLRLVPSVRLDSEHADLFRDEAAAIDLQPRGAWRSFVSAGRGRRRGAPARAALGAILPGRQAEDAVALAAAPLNGRDLEAAAEAGAEALEAASGPWTWWVTEEGERLGRHLSARCDPAVVPAGDAPARETLFPAGGTRDLWRTLVRDGGYLRRGDGAVRLAAGPAATVIPRRVPDDIVVLEGSGQGRAAYVDFLAAAGEALALAHLPPGLPVEHRRLSADAGAAIYGCLFARRMQSPAWLEARGVTGKATMAAAGETRANWRRRTVERLRAAAAGHADPPAVRRFAALGWEESAAEVIARVCGARPAAAMVEAEVSAALLDELLQSRFGRRWDENRRSADLLRDLWSEGWRRPTVDLLSSLGVEDTHGELLEQQLA